MSFTDDLRLRTKTTEQIESEKREAVRKKMESWHYQVRRECERAADNGKHECKCQVDCGTSRAEAEMGIEYLLRLLKKDGFREPTYYLKDIFAPHSYPNDREAWTAYITLSW